MPENGSWNSTGNNFTATQSPSVIPEQKLEKISKKPEITSSAKIIIEDIYKTCFEQKRIT